MTTLDLNLVLTLYFCIAHLLPEIVRASWWSWQNSRFREWSDGLALWHWQGPPSGSLCKSERSGPFWTWIIPSAQTWRGRILRCGLTWNGNRLVGRNHCTFAKRNPPKPGTSHWSRCSHEAFAQRFVTRDKLQAVVNPTTQLGASYQWNDSSTLRYLTASNQLMLF